MHFAFIFTIKGREGKRKRKKVMVIKGYIYFYSHVRPLRDQEMSRLPYLLAGLMGFFEGGVLFLATS